VFLKRLAVYFLNRWTVKFSQTQNRERLDVQRKFTVFFVIVQPSCVGECLGVAQRLDAADATVQPFGNEGTQQRLDVNAPNVQPFDMERSETSSRSKQKRSSAGRWNHSVQPM
jgi:hypothetical protein